MMQSLMRPQVKLSGQASSTMMQGKPYKIPRSKINLNNKKKLSSSNNLGEPIERPISSLDCQMATQT